MSKQKPVTPAQGEKIRELHAGGHGDGDIAKQIGIPRARVTTWRHREMGKPIERFFEPIGWQSYRPGRLSEAEINAMYAKLGRDYRGRVW